MNACQNDAGQRYGHDQKQVYSLIKLLIEKFPTSDRKVFEVERVENLVSTSTPYSLEQARRQVVRIYRIDNSLDACVHARIVRLRRVRSGGSLKLNDDPRNCRSCTADKRAQSSPAADQAPSLAKAHRIDYWIVPFCPAHLQLSPALLREYV